MGTRTTPKYVLWFRDEQPRGCTTEFARCLETEKDARDYAKYILTIFPNCEIRTYQLGAEVSLTGTGE